MNTVILHKDDKHPPQEENFDAIRKHLEYVAKVDIHEIILTLQTAKQLYYKQRWHQYNFILSRVRDAITEIKGPYLNRRDSWYDMWLENLCNRAIEKACPSHELGYLERIQEDFTINIKIIDRAIQMANEWKRTGKPRKCFFAKRHRKAYAKYVEQEVDKMVNKVNIALGENNV